VRPLLTSGQLPNQTRIASLSFSMRRSGSRFLACDLATSDKLPSVELPALGCRWDYGFDYILPITKAMKERSWVLRPWTEEEEADYERFCASIGEIPEDPEHAAAMEDGEIDFFNNDPFVGVKLYRA
jgi:hypothetical protein